MDRFRPSGFVSAIIVGGIVLGGLSPAEAQEPMTITEIRDCVDWAKLPRLPGAKDFQKSFTSCSYEAPGPLDDAVAFFRKAFPQIGWVEDITPKLAVDPKYAHKLESKENENGSTVVFKNGAIQLAVSCFQIKPMDSNGEAPMEKPDMGKPRVGICVSLLGNVDLRKFPKPAGAVILDERGTNLVYTTTTAPKEAARLYAKGLLEKGWREEPVSEKSIFKEGGAEHLEFFKNGMGIVVMAIKDEKDGSTDVQCIVEVCDQFDPHEVRAAMRVMKDVSAPPKVKECLVVLDLRKFPLMPNAHKRDEQTRAMAMSNNISYQVPATLEEVVSFHRKEFAARGWTETANRDVSFHAELTFEKQGYFVTIDANRSAVTKAVEIEINFCGNIDLRQMPYPPGTKIRTERDATMRTSTTLKEAAAVEFYRKELSKLGWKEDKGRSGQDAWAFVQNASVLTLSFQKGLDDGVYYTLSQGLLPVE